MKKVFISQPMTGLADEEIRKVREKAIEKVKEYLKEPVEIIDSYVPYYPEGTKPLFWLSKSLEKLSEADAAFFVRGWRDSRGCRVERICCGEYGIEIINEE